MNCEDTYRRGGKRFFLQTSICWNGSSSTEGLFLHPASFIAKSCAHPDDIVVVRAFVVTGLLKDMLLDGCLTREA